MQARLERACAWARGTRRLASTAQAMASVGFAAVEEGPCPVPLSLPNSLAATSCDKPGETALGCSGERFEW